MYQYILKNKREYGFALLFSLICFGFMLTNHTISIDEETWVLSNSVNFGWISQGRFGIFLLNLLFSNHSQYTPFLWDCLAIAFWNFSGIVFFYSLFQKEEPDSWKLIFMQSYYVSLPFVVGEILSFSMFNFQISLGMVFTALAFYYSTHLFAHKKKSDAAVAVLLLLFSISIYQAFICVYVTAVVAYFLLQFLGEKSADLQKILPFAVTCIAATVFYFVINKLLMILTSSSSYLTENYIGWFSKNGILYAAFMALANIVRVSFAITIQGEHIYGGFVIRILTISFVLFSVYTFFHSKGVKRKSGVFFWTIVFVAAPFSLYLALGTYKTHGRMLLALPLVGALEIYFIFQFLRKSILKRIGILIVSFLLFLNVRNMNQLFYASSVAYEHDTTTANEIMHDIRTLGLDYHNKPIVLIGMAPMDDVGLTTSDTVGASIFAWDDGNISRMVNFIRTEGYSVTAPSAKQIQNAYDASAAMSKWPQNGSIKELHDTIIIYLSDPSEKWFISNHCTNTR
ncbi:MAG: glucosyltransferase domain-containing protein [Hespellia sp.]|nr:glucosyltransferase domain-containing protein [Hespellia sp.]